MPLNNFLSILFLSATAIKKANNIAAVELIVIDIDTSSNGILLNKISISANELIGTPTLPISP